MIPAPHQSTHLTASDLRAALARDRGRAYCVAARLQMHPTTLSLILNGHRAFDQALAGRIIEALKLEQCAKQNNAAFQFHKRRIL